LFSLWPNFITFTAQNLYPFLLFLSTIHIWDWDYVVEHMFYHNNSFPNITSEMNIYPAGLISALDHCKYMLSVKMSIEHS
jgi:hypothetical protein